MKKAFTLIELLVVISIISLLSSIVLSSLNSARQKGRDAAIKSTMLEVRKLVEMDYLQTNSYANLQHGVWMNSDALCNTSGAFAGNYASQFIEMCKQLAKNSPGLGGDPNYKFFPSVISNLSYNENDYYSFMVILNNLNLFCIGSSGAIYEGTYDLNAKGCHLNP